MKRFKNISISIIGILMAIIISVCPKYYIYASSETPDQTVTNDDNNVQKVFDYWASMAGACMRGVGAITKLPETARNRCYETIASLFNGGGIYVDSDGNYVFSNDASRQIYNALMSDSDVDANVISDFNNFTYYTDGYVNAQYLQYCNEVTAWSRDVLSTSNSGDYMLFACRYHYQDNSQDYITTALYGYKLYTNFSFVSIKPFNNSAVNNGLYFINNNAEPMSIPYLYCTCTYSVKSGTYSANKRSSSLNTTTLHWGGTNGGGIPNTFLTPEQLYLSFPYFNNTDFNSLYHDYYDTKWNYYCNNSLILAKNVASGNSLANQTNGIFADYVNLGTVNKTIIENNNWNNIYNNYIQNVNIDYQQDPSMSTSDFRKVMKKYSSAIIDAIQQGNQDIEETVSISNRYLQAISVDVRNISDKLDTIIENGGGGGSAGGGLTDEQYNTLIGLINNINDHAVDIASNTDGSYLELQDISDNTATTNTNLVAMKGVLDSINSKIRSRNDKPLPDPDFWDNLTDDLIDITDTTSEKFVNAMSVIATAFKTVVPFGYIAVVGVLLSSLAEDPEPPVFEIDLQNDSGTIPLNWQGSIDLTWVDSIMPIVRALECIVFIIGLIVFTFTVFSTLGALFS